MSFAAWKNLNRKATKAFSVVFFGQQSKFRIQQAGLDGDCSIVHWR
jgi:hypothetical protein